MPLMRIQLVAEQYAALDLIEPAGTNPPGANRIYGTVGQLRPVLITALVVSLGFVPMAVNVGAGAVSCAEPRCRLSVRLRLGRGARRNGDHHDWPTKCLRCLLSLDTPESTQSTYPPRSAPGREPPVAWR